MGQTITVVSGKGGTGKTSFVSNAGMALAQMGYRTLCLDCDVGLRNLDISMGMTDRAVMDFNDVVEGYCTLEEAAVEHPDEENLYLLTAPTNVDDGAAIDLPKFKALFPQIEDLFDYCLVDAPAGLGPGFRLAIAGASRAIVVTTTEESSLRDAQRTVMELNENPISKIHLVVNRCRRKLMRSLHQTIDDAIDKAGLPLLGVVPEDDTIPLYVGRGIPLLLSDNRCAAHAYRNIARRLVGERVPMMRIR